MKSILNIFLVIVGLVVPFSASATDCHNALLSMDEVKLMQEEVTPLLLEVEGIGGIGISLCNAETGAKVNPAGEPLEAYCILALAKNDESLRSFIQKFGSNPFKYKNVWILAEITGESGI